MSINPNTVALAEELAKLNGNELQLSTKKILVQRYVETCQSITSRNQIHIEFKSTSPISLNPKYVATISKYVETLNVKVYDIHSNLRDRVYVYCYPKKPGSPLAVVKAQQAISTTPSKVKPDSTDLKWNPAVKKTQFNGKTHLTPIVFIRKPETVGATNNGEPSARMAPVPFVKETKAIEATDNGNQSHLTPSTSTELEVVEATNAGLNRVKNENTDSKFRRNENYHLVPTDYNSLMYHKTRLTNNDTFNKLRRFLACYTLENFQNNKDLYLFTESESYVSLKTQLINEGLPSDNRTLRELYIEFLMEKGFSKEMVNKDLEKLKIHYDNSHMIRSNQVKTNFKTYYYGESSARIRYITEEGMTHTAPGRTTPDVCVVV